MSAKKVAEYAYKKHKAKKTIILPGLLPKLMVLGARLAPRSLCRKVVMSIQKK
jgi:short-subunit dehydrogenase